MALQYTDLIQDHDEIAIAAGRLVSVAFDETLPGAVVLQHLHDLAITVRDHIAIESPLVALLDEGRLTGPWLAAWQRGRPEYLSLVSDWQDFPADWDLTTIEADRSTFQQEATIMMSRLEERTTMESRTFYALALQKGAVQFHIR